MVNFVTAPVTNRELVISFCFARLEDISNSSDDENNNYKNNDNISKNSNNNNYNYNNGTEDCALLKKG